MQHPPTTDADPLAAVRDADGSVDLLKLGRIVNHESRGLPLSPEDRAAWNHYASNGGGWTLMCAGRAYDDDNIEKLYRHARHTGRTITTERHEWRDGKHTVTRTVERFPAPTRRPCSRVVSRSRERRAPARRTSSSSATSGTDPGSSSDPPPPAPSLRLAPPPKAIYTFGFAPVEDAR